MTENKAPGWVWWCGMMALVCFVTTILSLRAPIISNTLCGFTMIFCCLVSFWFIGDMARETFNSIRPRHQEDRENEQT